MISGTSSLSDSPCCAPPDADATTTVKATLKSKRWRSMGFLSPKVGILSQPHAATQQQAGRLPFSSDRRTLILLLADVNVAYIFIAFIVLLFSLTVHEMAHAWTADRLGDPTARLLGRVSLNPLVHADPIGTVLFPLIAFTTHAPLIGWAKPVPVNIRQLRHQRRDYVLVAGAGPASNLVIAFAAASVLALLPVSPQIHGEANVSAPTATMLSMLMRLNVLLAVFNLVPIPPLD